MKRSDPPSIPPDVQRLLEAEREAVRVPDEVAARLESQIARRLRDEPPEPARRPSWLARLRGLMGLFPGWAFPLVAFGLGTTVGVEVGSGWVARDLRRAGMVQGPARPEAPAPMAPAIDVPPQPATVPAAPALAPEPVHAPVPVAPPPSSAPKAAGPDSLDQERALIERARTALYRGSDETALRLLDECAAAFPRGQLAEEREALWIQSAVGAAKYKAARERGRTFAQKYPHSLLLPSVEEALRSVSE